MASVTFLLAVDVPDISAPALLNEAESIIDDLDGNHVVLSCVPWARPTLPEASPAGGFSSLTSPNPLGGTPPPGAPTA